MLFSIYQWKNEAKPAEPAEKPTSQEEGGYQMFFSNIIIAKKYNYLEEKFLAAYKWLEETDIAALPVGSYPILGDQVVANIQEYTTIQDRKSVV